MTTGPPGDDAVRRHFDALGDQEWDRLVVDARSEVSLELHRRLLTQVIRPGDLVLEIGAGPGRFTIELAELGASVVVTDVSAVQLDLNARHVAEAGKEAAVMRRELLDIRDLSGVEDNTYNAVVAFGGPLSYAFEQAEAAFGELLRVTRPSGVVCASVMATAGTSRFFLPSILDDIANHGVDSFATTLQTGDTRHIDAGAHACRMFRWSDLVAIIDSYGAHLVAASASNCLSLGDSEAMARVRADPDLWPRFCDWEANLAAEPGALDGGTHILFAVTPA